MSLPQVHLTGNGNSFQVKEMTTLDLKDPPPGKMAKNEGSPLLAGEQPSAPGVLCCTIL